MVQREAIFAANTLKDFKVINHVRWLFYHWKVSCKLFVLSMSSLQMFRRVTDQSISVFKWIASNIEKLNLFSLQCCNNTNFCINGHLQWTWLESQRKDFFILSSLCIPIPKTFTFQTLAQCESRAHRIGQKSPVTCRYLLAKGTADDFIWAMLKRKQDVLNKAGLFSEDLSDATHTIAPIPVKNL